MDIKVAEKLKEIIHEYGFDDIHEDENELENFLNELYPNKETEIKVISLCTSVGIPDRFSSYNHDFSSEKKQIKKEVNKLIKDFSNQHSIKSDKAKWAILSWAYIYDLIPKNILSNNGKEFLADTKKRKKDKKENKKRNEGELTLEEIKKEIAKNRPGLLRKEVAALAREKKYG